jgi:DDE superfamily endonuclease
LQTVLNRALAHQELLPAPNTNDLAVILARKWTEGVPGLPFWHDGTERPIQRPSDPEEQQEYYSGKKKCHTVKNLLVIDETCHICFLSEVVEDKEHDKNLAELASYTLRRGSYLYQDMGF